MLVLRPSSILSLSTVSSTPKGRTLSLGSHCLKYKHNKRPGPWWVPQEAPLDPLAHDQPSQAEGTGRGRQTGMLQAGGHEGTYFVARPLPGPQDTRLTRSLEGSPCAPWRALSLTLPWRVRELCQGSGADAMNQWNDF